MFGLKEERLPSRDVGMFEGAMVGTIVMGVLAFLLTIPSCEGVTRKQVRQSVVTAVHGNNTQSDLAK